MSDAERWLRSARLFSGADLEDLRALAAATLERRYGPGEVVVAEGAAIEGLFVVAEGRVVVSQHIRTTEGTGVQVALGSGETLGELNVVDGSSSEWTAVAREATRSLLLPRQAFLELLAARPALARAVMATLASWARQADRRAAELALRGAEAAPFAFRRPQPAPGDTPESSQERAT